MLSNKFTLLELTDLALRVPEIGAVNFNILHTVLTGLIMELGLDNLKIPCHIEDENLAQVSITKTRLQGSRKPSKVYTVTEMKQMRENLEKQMASNENVHQPEEKSSAEVVQADSEVTVTVQKGDADEEASGEKTESHVTEETDEAGLLASDQEEDGEDEFVKEVIENQNEAIEDLKSELEDLKAEIKDLKADEGETQEATEDQKAEREAVIEETLDKIVEKKADIVVKKVVDKILEDDNLLESESPKLVQELWRATNLNRRMEAAEVVMKELSSLMDVIINKVHNMEEENSKMKAMFEEVSELLERIEALEETCKILGMRIEDCNEERAVEVERLEGMIKNLTKEHQETVSALEALSANLDDLAGRVAYKDDLELLEEQMSEALELKIKEIKKLLREVEDTLVKKEDFMEIVARVDELEETKISREELGRLLEPGFIDNFLEEQANLRNELEELKITVSELETNLETLSTRLEEEVIKTMETNFDEVHAMLDTINSKLALLDPDEINDSFASLEEQTDMILAELNAIKSAAEQFQKEARINANKILNVNELLNRLDQTKADKEYIHKLLDMKADVDMVLNKLDRSEFVAVVGEMNETLGRLSIKVKINEEDMNHNFTSVRHELSLKMYTEDFITGTEPIRNRIKALMYELERVKRLFLTHLFPDAPGVVKCISCKRGANLAGPKYLGDAHVEFLQEVPPKKRVKMGSSKLSKESDVDHSEESSDVKFPPLDLDSVPIPSPDKPREKDALRLPLLLATARPQIGLAHEKRRTAIDRKLAAYFATRPIRSCDGEHTRTLPMQRGLDFTTVKLPQTEKEEVLLEGVDKGLYRGAVYDNVVPDDMPGNASRIEKIGSRDVVSPSVVSLHVDGEPVQRPVPLFRSCQAVLPRDRSLKEALKKSSKIL